MRDCVMVAWDAGFEAGLSDATPLKIPDYASTTLRVMWVEAFLFARSLTAESVI